MNLCILIFRNFRLDNRLSLMDFFLQVFCFFNFLLPHDFLIAAQWSKAAELNLLKWSCKKNINISPWWKFINLHLLFFLLQILWTFIHLDWYQTYKMAHGYVLIGMDVFVILPDRNVGFFWLDTFPKSWNVDKMCLKHPCSPEMALLKSDTALKRFRDINPAYALHFSFWNAERRYRHPWQTFGNLAIIYGW